MAHVITAQLDLSVCPSPINVPLEVTACGGIGFWSNCIRNERHEVVLAGRELQHEHHTSMLG